MGLASNYTAGNFGPITLAKSFRILAGLYVNDNFRVTRKLTLNLGLRWDPGTHSRDDIRICSHRFFCQWENWLCRAQRDIVRRGVAARGLELRRRGDCCHINRTQRGRAQ